MKNSMNNVPTFGNKTKPKPTQLSSLSQSHRTLIIQWEDIENAFVTIENRLSIVFIFMVIVAAEVTWAQSMDRGKLLGHFDLFFSFDLVASGFLLLLLLYLIWCAGLKTLFFFKTNSSFGTANVIDFIVAIIHQVSMYLYSYKNANMYSCLIWIRLLFVRGLAIVVSSCKLR